MTEYDRIWSEVKTTSEGISVSLYGEKGDGPELLEETWRTYEELKAENEIITLTES